MERGKLIMSVELFKKEGDKAICDVYFDRNEMSSQDVINHLLEVIESYKIAPIPKNKSTF